MTLVVNGVEVEEIIYNGVTVELGYFNGQFFFEPPHNAMVLTVGNLEGALGKFGYDFYEGMGALDPRTIESFPEAGQINQLYWYGANGDTPQFIFSVEDSSKLPAKVKITIDGIQIIVPRDGFEYLTSGVFASLPKGGFHEITIESA